MNVNPKTDFDPSDAFTDLELVINEAVLERTSDLDAIPTDDKRRISRDLAEGAPVVAVAKAYGVGEDLVSQIETELDDRQVLDQWEEELDWIFDEPEEGEVEHAPSTYAPKQLSVDRGD